MLVLMATSHSKIIPAEVRQRPTMADAVKGAGMSGEQAVPRCDARAFGTSVVEKSTARLSLWWLPLKVGL